MALAAVLIKAMSSRAKMDAVKPAGAEERGGYTEIL